MHQKTQYYNKHFLQFFKDHKFLFRRVKFRSLADYYKSICFYVLIYKIMILKSYLISKGICMLKLFLRVYNYTNIFWIFKNFFEMILNWFGLFIFLKLLKLRDGDLYRFSLSMNYVTIYNLDWSIYLNNDILYEQTNPLHWGTLRKLLLSNT